MAAFEELLSRDGKLVYKTKGVSMLPMLRQNRDLVVIGVPASRLGKYDVALYKRGADYVLHRVVGVRENGYLIRGDNTYILEHVPEGAVIGVLRSFVRDGKSIEVTDPGYLAYVRFWNAAYPLRFAIVRCRRAFVRAAELLGIKPFLKRMML